MSKTYVHENELNVRMASVLSESFGLDCRAERASRRARSDIRCFYNGFRIVIEASYSKSDAEKDANKRVEDGLADIAIALHYPERYPDIPEGELKKKLRESVFNAMIVVPREVRNLEKYVLGKTRVAKPVGGWFNNIKLGDLVDIIRHSVSYLLEEAEVEQEVEEVKKCISEFTKAANSLQESDKLREGIAEVLYKLYGFEVAEARDAEVMFGQVALSILLSSILYERVRHFHSLKPLMDYVKQYGPINGLRDAFNSLLKVDYEPALTFTMEILDKLPPHLSLQVGNIVNSALRISEMTSLLARDFAGRVYHEIVGDIAVRKGFATFYTEIPAAYMLSNLAIKTLLDVNDIKKLDKNQASAVINTLCKLKVVDFACGSGTLLTASLYNTSRLARNVCFLHDLECSCREIEGDKESSASIEKTLVEKGIYGLDALRYATQVTALNLALMVPESITRENIATVYLGVMPNKNAWLGSLELLDNVKTFGGLLRWIESGLKGVVETVSTTRVVSGNIELLDKYDIVIMNPPFTRATGRVSKEFREKRKGLFGFIADENNRKILMKRYDKVRKSVREELKKIAKNLIKEDPALRKYMPLFAESEKDNNERDDEDESQSWEDLDQYLSIGQAGEGLLFLYLAYRYVKLGGVIAFVLPRNLLSGVSWFLARTLLASKFHLKYVIVSSDGENGYNFSEGASLSEVLIIAKRVDSHSNSEETYFIELLKKPQTALEGLLYADRLSEAIKGGRNVVIVKDGIVAKVKKILRKDLLSFIINWGVFYLEEDLLKMLRDLIENGKIGSASIPMTTLGSLVTDMGVNRGGDVIEAFNLIVRGGRVDCATYQKRQAGILYIPMVCGSGEEVAKTIEIQPNAYIPDVTNPKAMRIKRLRTKFLVPNRIRWNTFRAVAHLSTEPVVSNVYFMVKTDLYENRQKALVLWINSFWGLLTIFSLMEITEEVFTRLNIGQWKMLPVLDVKSLASDVVEKLSKLYEKYRNADFGPLIDQFKTCNRAQLDKDVLEALSIRLDRSIEELYELFYQTMSAMSRKHSKQPKKQP
ncbi:MAG: hypothetical protein QW196_05270 [Sulfolobales archaeon]